MRIRLTRKDAVKPAQNQKVLILIHISVEHVFLPANKEQITDKYSCFLATLTEYDIFSFSYLSAEVNLCSIELSMKKDL